MPVQLEKYYGYLKQNGADVPDNFNSFKTTLSDEKNAGQYYNYLKENKFDVPETFDSFSNTFGLKKKPTLSSPLMCLSSSLKFHVLTAGNTPPRPRHPLRLRLLLLLRAPGELRLRR